MSKKDASAAEDTAVVEAATEEDDPDTATDEEMTIAEEDTENAVNPKISFFML